MLSEMMMMMMMMMMMTMITNCFATGLADERR